MKKLTISNRTDKILTIKNLLLEPKAEVVIFDVSQAADSKVAIYLLTECFDEVMYACLAGNALFSVDGAPLLDRQAFEAFHESLGPMLLPHTLGYLASKSPMFFYNMGTNRLWVYNPIAGGYYESPDFKPVSE